MAVKQEEDLLGNDNSLSDKIKVYSIIIVS